MQSSLRLRILLLALCSLVGERAFAEQRPTPEPEIRYEAQVRPLLATYCIGCHEGDQAEKSIAIDALSPTQLGGAERKKWSRILAQLTAGAMPPVGESQPTMEERELLERWIRSTALAVDCDGPAFPGRVTVRRLNRAEYNNTVRDLVGIDFQPADDFPSDDIGYGFDNIGDVLTIPPVLMERYLDAADLIARRAILTPDADQAPIAEHEGRVLASSGEVGHEFQFSKTGEYILKAYACGDQAGPDPVRMAFRLDGKDLQTVDVVRGRDQFEPFQVEIKVEQGKHRFAVAFTNDYYEPDNSDPKLRGDRNLHVERIVVIGPIGVLPDVLPESHLRLVAKTPPEKAGRDAQLKVAAENLRPFIKRAFRRPVTNEEVARYLGLVRMVLEDGGSFERGMQVAVQGVLVSPHFLFRAEVDPAGDDPRAVRALNDYELASRLSYFLWASLPDEELFAAAAAGRLSKKDELTRQALRMLKDPKAAALVDGFAAQWLQLGMLDVVAPDRRRFRGYDKDLKDAMRRETEMLFSSIIQEDRSLLELLSADYTFVNEQLAKHYGIEGVSGEEFRRVSVNLEQRGGLLGHAAILTVTSNPTRTSPVKRGKWVLDNLLASPPPPAPADVPPLKDDRELRGKVTLRQRMEQHRSKPACATCHELMDPIGFGLENYDAVGAWRTEEKAGKIDASGILPDGSTFTGPAELRKILLQRSDDFRRCITEKLLTYALGRGIEYYDQCEINRITAALEKEGDRFSVLVTEIVNSEPFRKRARSAQP